MKHAPGATARTVTVDGRTLTFHVVEEATEPAVIFLGVRKSGSSIFFKMCQAVANNLGANCVSVAHDFFNADIPVGRWRNLDEVTELLAPGNCYLGFRAAPTAFKRSRHFRKARKSLLVRDPRDALVSQYFSTAYSHSLPAGSSGPGAAPGVRERLLSQRESALNTSVDEFVLQSAPSLVRIYREYTQLLNNNEFQLLRYEDVIFDKRRLLATIAAQFGGTLSEAFVDSVIAWADVRPSSEKPQEFVRKVTPGDHRDKLSAATIAALNDSFREAVAPFGYALP